MVNHTCPTCNKNFIRKADLIYHLERKKKPCRPNGENGEKMIQNDPWLIQNDPKNHFSPLDQTILDQDNKLKVTIKSEHNDLEKNLFLNLKTNLSSEPSQNQNSLEITKNLSQIPVNPVHPVVKQIKITNSSDLNCNYCGKKFSNNSNLIKHIKCSCKVKKLHDLEKEAIFQQLIKKDQIIDDNNEKLNKLLEFNKEILKQNKDFKNKYDQILKQNEKLQKKIDLIVLNKSNELVQSTQSIHPTHPTHPTNPTNPNHIPTQNINNISNINNVNNNINNVNNLNINVLPIKLVGFGEEDLDKIKLKYFLDPTTKKSGKHCIINLTENIHFNPEYPEYQNIYISDINREKYMVFNGKEWILKKNTILYDVLENLFKFCRLKYEEVKQTYKSNPKIISKVDIMFTKYFNLLTGDFDESDTNILKKAEDFQNMINNELKLLLYNKKEGVIHNFNNINKKSNSLENDNIDTIKSIE